MSVNYCSGRVVRASAPSPSPARGRRRAAGRRGRVDGADNLDSQRQVSRPSETDWHCNGRAAGHRCRERNLHPAVIRIHRLSGDFSWPRNVRIEREQLRSWQSEKIVTLKCPTECVINLRAPYRSAPDIQGAQLQRALNFPDRLRPQLGPLLRVRIHLGQEAADQPMSPRQPRRVLPHPASSNARTPLRPSSSTPGSVGSAPLKSPSQPMLVPLTSCTGGSSGGIAQVFRPCLEDAGQRLPLPRRNHRL